MSDDRTETRWSRLAAAGLVRGESPVAPIATAPWMIGALVGAAAWLAALFLLFFLGLALEDFVRRPAGAISTGLVVCAAACAVLRIARDRLFVAQLAFAFSLAGQALVLVGIVMESGRDEAWRWWLFAVFEAVLVFVVPHGGHRVLATFAAAMGALVALWVMSFSTLFLPLVLGAFVAVESRSLAASRRPELWHALAIGLALALLGAFVHASVPELWRPNAAAGAWTAIALRWISVVLLAIASACAGILLARDTAPGSTRGAALAAASLAALAIVAFKLPAVAASFVMLLMAFAAGQRVIAGLAIVALVASLAHYYYRLDTTLLDKAAAWLAIGLALLLARIVVLRLMPPDRESSDA
jgi:Domain of unknown function (DUF4401)